MIYPYIMVYGPAGGGKTWFCKAAAEHVGWERTLWINTERPILSFAPHLWTPAESWGVRDMQDSTVEEIIDVIRPSRAKAEKGTQPYDLYVFDGITETEFVNLEDIKGESDKKDTRQVWGEQADDLLRLIWMLRAGRREPHPMHMGAYVIITAGQIGKPNPTVPTRSDGSPNLIYRPAIRGMWGEHGDRHFNMVLYAERTGTNRRLHIKATGSIHVKNDWEHNVSVSPLVVDGGNPFTRLLVACGIGGVVPKTAVATTSRVVKKEE